MTDKNIDDNRMITDAAQEAAWLSVLARRARADAPLDPAPLSDLYGPLCDAGRAGLFAVGHLAQSLDGRIATSNGVSQWISGAADLLHTHRMRALVDAVIVGVNTVLHDDPQLTVRRCAGANPVRVVIDPERRLDGSQRVFTDGAAPTLLLVAADCVRKGATPDKAELVAVARSGTGLDPHEIRRVLAQRGLGRRARSFADHGGAGDPWFRKAGHRSAGDCGFAPRAAAAHAPLRARRGHHDRMRFPCTVICAAARSGA
jgi:hypothetical protein